MHRNCTLAPTSGSFWGCSSLLACSVRRRPADSVYYVPWCSLVLALCCFRHPCSVCCTLLDVSTPLFCQQVAAATCSLLLYNTAALGALALCAGVCSVGRRCLAEVHTVRSGSQPVSLHSSACDVFWAGLARDVFVVLPSQHSCSRAVVVLQSTHNATLASKQHPCSQQHKGLLSVWHTALASCCCGALLCDAVGSAAAVP